MIRVDCVQGSSDWFASRLKRVTASRMADVMNYLKNGNESQARKDYKREIIVETLTHFPVEHYVSPAMLHGKEQEQFARALYEVTYGVSVEQVGFGIHSKINRFGGSPDGLIRQDGGTEFKCPTSTTHLDWILADEIPEQHVPQLLANMSVWEREWWEFVSFDDRFPPHLKLFVKRMYRDDKRIAEMEAGVIQFLNEVDAMIDSLPKAEDNDSPASIIAQAEAEMVAKQVAEDLLLITGEEVKSFTKETIRSCE